MLCSVGHYLPIPVLHLQWVESTSLSKPLIWITYWSSDLVFTLLQFLINMTSREILLKHVSQIIFHNSNPFTGLLIGKTNVLKMPPQPSQSGPSFPFWLHFLLLYTLLPLSSAHWYPFCSLNTPGTFLPHCLSVWLFPLLVRFTPQVCTLLSPTSTLCSFLNFISPIKNFIDWLISSFHLFPTTNNLYLPSLLSVFL